MVHGKNGAQNRISYWNSHTQTECIVETTPKTSTLFNYMNWIPKTGGLQKSDPKMGLAHTCPWLKAPLPPGWSHDQIFCHTAMTFTWAHCNLRNCEVTKLQNIPIAYLILNLEANFGFKRCCLLSWHLKLKIFWKYGEKGWFRKLQ